MSGVQKEFADGEVVSGTRYRVVGLIGSGGMGSVYEVEHQELGKRFVLKALLRSLTNRDDLVHRLRNEWRALGRLEHPNIVSVTDAGVTTTGVPFYVMERLQGETLSVRLRRERRLRLPDALGIAADVLDGLSAAHHIGVVHRDVKPANIYLVGGGRVAKLLDFGIAKMLDPKASQITGRGVAIGTPRYMAPEQATGGTVDARTDLYATGLILFEMIAGSGPFDGARDANELFLAHLAQEAPPVSSRAAGVPAELDRWLSRLLAKKSEDRPGDAAAVAVELRALRKRLSGAPPPSEPSRPEDRTIPGGPFDTLEGAQTVASEGQGRAQTSVNEMTTRTSVGPYGADAQSGQTLRLETFPIQQHPHLPMEEPEAPTRTAAPVAAPGPFETPPPVEPSQQSVRVPAPKRRGPWVGAVVVAAVMVGAALAVAAAVLFRTRGLPGSSAAGAPPQAELPAATASRVSSSADAGPTSATAVAPPPALAPPAPVASVAPPAPVASAAPSASVALAAAPMPVFSGVRPALPARPAPAVARRAAPVAAHARGASDPAVLPGSGL